MWVKLRIYPWGVVSKKYSEALMEHVIRDNERQTKALENIAETLMLLRPVLKDLAADASTRRKEST